MTFIFLAASGFRTYFKHIPSGFSSLLNVGLQAMSVFMFTLIKNYIPQIVLKRHEFCLRESESINNNIMKLFRATVQCLVGLKQYMKRLRICNYNELHLTGKRTSFKLPRYHHCAALYCAVLCCFEEHMHWLCVIVSSSPITWMPLLILLRKVERLYYSVLFFLLCCNFPSIHFISIHSVFQI